MKYFIDTEFREIPNTIELISIGIVDEDGREYSALSKEFNLYRVWIDDWLRENVLKPIWEQYQDFGPFAHGTMADIIEEHGKYRAEMSEEIQKFVREGYIGREHEWPEFYGYYADYDWVVFCWIFGRMIDLPDGFPMYCRDLKQMMDERGLNKEWTKKNCPQAFGKHVAISDARWNRELYNAILEECGK